MSNIADQSITDYVEGRQSKSGADRKRRTA
jgi:hypothetical protein